MISEKGIISTYYHSQKCLNIFNMKYILIVVSSPMTQKGFLANFSLPLHPLYRQQQPADHILTIYSTPNTTMVTISCTATPQSEVEHIPRTHCSLHAEKKIRTRMYKALSELFLNSLMVAKTERMRQEKTNRKLKVKEKNV